jgi:hypothetical protein
MVGKKEGGEVVGNVIFDPILGYDRPKNADDPNDEVQGYSDRREPNLLAPCLPASRRLISLDVAPAAVPVRYATAQDEAGGTVRSLDEPLDASYDVLNTQPPKEL